MGDETTLILQYVVPAVIGSSVLTALVNQLFGSLSNKKKDSIENITKERDLWRKELRNITKQLSIVKWDDKDTILQKINEIKVLINPFGESSWKNWNKNNFTSWVKNDGFLWEKIEEIESKINNDNFDWEKSKKELIYSISILLKLDWERSKIEVRGNKVKNITFGIIVVIEVLTLILFTDLITFVIENPINQTWWMIVVLSCILFTPFLLRFFLLDSDYRMIDILQVFTLIPFIFIGCNAILYLYEEKDIYLNGGEVSLILVLYLLVAISVSAEIGGTYIGKVSSYYKENKKRNRHAGKKLFKQTHRKKLRGRKNELLDRLEQLEINIETIKEKVAILEEDAER